jgi:outer membrane lipoprotein-sorting protein
MQITRSTLSANPFCKKLRKAHVRSAIEHAWLSACVDIYQYTGGKSMKSLTIALALLLALLPAAALAEDYYVEISNETGYTIYYVYVSPDDSDSWEEDVLGKEVLMDGNSRRINLYGYKSPIFDIKLVDEDGDSYTFYNVDVSKRDITATLDDLDK